VQELKNVFPDVQASAAEKESSLQEMHPFEVLLTEKGKSTESKQPVFGVAIGLLTRLAEGKATIAVPAYAIESCDAKIVCAIDSLHENHEVAIMFEGGDVARPLIIGPMADSKVDIKPKAAIADGERVVIEAENEIELRCGEAAIILTKDGRILLRGAYISSHASATQRIRGGSIQIN